MESSYITNQWKLIPKHAQGKYQQLSFLQSVTVCFLILMWSTLKSPWRAFIHLASPSSSSRKWISGFSKIRFTIFPFVPRRASRLLVPGPGWGGSLYRKWMLLLRWKHNESCWIRSSREIEWKSMRYFRITKVAYSFQTHCHTLGSTRAPSIVCQSILKCNLKKLVNTSKCLQFKSAPRFRSLYPPSNQASSVSPAKVRLYNCHWYHWSHRWDPPHYPLNPSRWPQVSADIETSRVGRCNDRPDSESGTTNRSNIRFVYKIVLSPWLRNSKSNDENCLKIH